MLQSEQKRRQGENVTENHNANTSDTNNNDEITPEEFRLLKVRDGFYNGPTNGICPGYLQCNLIVLQADTQYAKDFLKFCTINSKACPLIEICYDSIVDIETSTKNDTESDTNATNNDAFPASSVSLNSNSVSWKPIQLAPTADLRTDVPKYCIYENGRLVQEVTDATNYWPTPAIAFLIGSSFSYDGALQEAGIPLRSVDQNKNIPMYKTNIPCQPYGCIQGNMVVSMKPIPRHLIDKEIEITSQYPHSHGDPVYIGTNYKKELGIIDITKPDYGDAVEFENDDIPVFHACGVTPQLVLMNCPDVPYFISHSPGCMFVTDTPADMKGFTSHNDIRISKYLNTL